MIKVKIADLIIQLNIPIKILPDNMYKFLYKGAKEADIHWNVQFSNKCDVDECVYLVSKNFKVYKNDDELIYDYIKGIEVPFRVSAKDNFKNCDFYVSKSYENIEKNTRNMEIKLKDGLNNAFKEMFILACVSYNRLPMESSSVIYDNKAYLFTNVVGNDKDMHASLWEKEYGCEILNDTLVIAQVIDAENKQVVAYACPWCKEYMSVVNENIPFGGIAFLNKSNTNKIYELDKEDVGLRMLESLTIPLINKEIVDNEVVMINQISKFIKGYLLECNTEKEAAIVAKSNMIK